MGKYSRQVELLGEEQQHKLSISKVLVIGCGGLGSSVLMNLAVSGIGTIGFVDYDVVELSNLNRQIIHDESFLQDKKTDSTSHRLKRMNGDLEICPYSEKLTESLARQIMPLYDIIVDCVDNYETRQIVSKIATDLNLPLIEGGIEGFDGYVQIIIPHKTACFNCLGISQKPIQRQVVGAGVSIVGSIQALECIKILTNNWQGTYDYIALNLLTYEVDTLFLKTNSSCTCHINEMEI